MPPATLEWTIDVPPGAVFVTGAAQRADLWASQSDGSDARRGRARGAHDTRLARLHVCSRLVCRRTETSIPPTSPCSPGPVARLLRSRRPRGGRQRRQRRARVDGTHDSSGRPGLMGGWFLQMNAEYRSPAATAVGLAVTLAACSAWVVAFPPLVPIAAVTLRAQWCDSKVCTPRRRIAACHSAGPGHGRGS